MKSISWGSDLDIDLLRLNSAIQSARDNNSVLLIPNHPVLGQVYSTRYDFQSTEYKIDLESTASTDNLLPLKQIIANLQPLLTINEPPSKTRPQPDELVLYINNKDNQYQAPPPLSYYRYIIETRFWKKITIIKNTISNDLIVEYLTRHYPKIHTLDISDDNAWQYLLSASNIAIGSDLFAQASSISSLKALRIWIPEYTHNDLYKHNKQAKIFPIKIFEYFSKSQWNGTHEQQKSQLNHNPTNILDETRWTFTETEKCRSFEYCQSCRDTSPTGKLWRSIIQQRFDVPQREWVCPHGWKWGGKPGLRLWLKKKLKIGTVIKKTTTMMGVKACSDCQERGDKLDGNKA